MYKLSLDTNSEKALYALLGAGLGGAGGYGLYKLLTPTEDQSTVLGLGSSLTGALAGGGLGYLGADKLQQIRADMAAEGQKKRQAAADRVNARLPSRGEGAQAFPAGATSHTEAETARSVLELRRILSSILDPTSPKDAPVLESPGLGRSAMRPMGSESI